MSALRGAFSRAFFDAKPTAGVVAYRLLLSAWTIAYLVPRIPYVEELYCRPALRYPAESWKLLGDPIPPVWLVEGIIAFLLVCLVGMLVSTRPRIFHAALLLPFYVLLSLDTLMSRAYGDLALIQWFLLFFAPYERAFDRHDRPVSAPPFGTRLLQIEFASVYFFTVLSKLYDGDGWWDGQSIYYNFKNPRYGDWLLSSLPMSREFAMGLGWFTMATEWFLAFGLWPKKTRPFAMIACTIMHITMAVGLRVSPLFHTLMIGHLLLFLPPSVVEGWLRKLRAVPGLARSIGGA